ncbi:hypothetical protein [Agromyces ramosus]|uniref:Uncharacterized protein n=1 Tax=Agromyces ramosus TaxID=33879 RepID=A0ABU0R8F9_9MICO|nr:hypothetical protein [Agromyces ramosus]MDQ0893501.1 hypothetical protein [Agromyces ramosus]
MQPRFGDLTGTSERRTLPASDRSNSPTPRPGRPEAPVLLRLQRSAGNRATASLLATRPPPVIQRDDKVGGVCAPAAEPNSTPAAAPERAACEEQLHVLTYQGTQYAIPESKWPTFKAGLKRTFRSEVLRPIDSRMNMARGHYDSMEALNKDQKVVAWFLEAVRTGINLDEVAPMITAGEQALQSLKALAEGDDFPATEAATRTAQEKVDTAYRGIQEYRERQIGAGETTVIALQVVETAAFTIFAIAGGALLAAPIAAGGLGLGVVSSGAIIGGGTALLSSAAGVGAKVVYGGDVGAADLKNVTIDTVVGAVGGAAGGAVASKLAPYLAPALTRSLIANGMFTNVTEEALSKAVASVVAGSSGGVVQGAISDGVRVVRGQGTMEQLLRNVVTNLIVGGIAGLVGHALTSSGAISQPPVTTTPQTRNVRVANPELVARYEQAANERLPNIIDATIAAERVTPGRTRLNQLGTEFDAIRTQVGDAQALTPQQRARSVEILREARSLARDDFGNLQGKVMKRLRADPALQTIETQLVTAGDAQLNPTGTLRIKVVKADGTEGFEPFNLEHRIRLSDNPWMAKGSRNVILTDAPQNQQYLEALRQQGSVWPTDAVERFVVRFQLNDEGIDFAPGTR